MGCERQIDGFLAETILAEGFAWELAARAGLDATSAVAFVDDLASEARLAWRLLEPLAPIRAGRVLEVGAGAGVVAAFLHRQGVELLAIEPYVGGFELHDATRALLAERSLLPPIKAIAAAQLDPAQHGRFNLVFSINVVEHMRPLERNLDAVAGVLAAGGRMLHTCPNYRVPYEPHYRIPLVPVWPALTRLVARRASREPAWRSLNWITAGDVRRYARTHGLELEFRQDAFTASLARLGYDPAFARRQRGPITTALKFFDAIGLARQLARLPPTWLTPMTFVLTKPQAARFPHRPG